jgi:hypothetical protein
VIGKGAEAPFAAGEVGYLPTDIRLSSAFGFNMGINLYDRITHYNVFWFAVFSFHLL